MILTFGQQSRPVGTSTLEQVQALRDQAQAAALAAATQAVADAQPMIEAATQTAADDAVAAAEAQIAAERQAAQDAAQTATQAATTAATDAAAAIAPAAADAIRSQVATDADRAETASALAVATAGNKIDKVPGAQVGAAQDAAFSVDGNGGDFRVLEVGNDGRTRVANLTADRLQVPGFTFDPLGAVAADASVQSPEHRLPDGSSFGIGTSPDWAISFQDAEGNIAGGFHATLKKWLFHGLQTDDATTPPEITHTVAYAFAEPLGDPSEALLLSWVSTSADARTVEYRASGGEAWIAAGSHRSRPFPVVAGQYIHTAKMTGLGADMAYALRWPGAAFTDTVRTCPRTGVRACIGSDYHSTTFGTGSLINSFGLQFVAQDCDLLILNGDHVTDNGQWTAAIGQRWFSYMQELSSVWRRGGAMVPMAATMGNHEGSGADGTGNAISSGNGIPGPMIDIFSLGFDPEAKGYHRRSDWSFTVGREVAFIGYETSHTELIANQTEWMAAEFARLAPMVRHINLCGHAPAFMARWGTWERDHINQAPKIKELIWPIMQQYASKVRAYWVGHEHNVSATARLTFDWQASLTLAQNHDRWRTDPVNGIRQLGSGTIGSSVSPLSEAPGEVDRASSLDGSPKMIASLTWDATNGFQTYGEANSTGASNGHNNMWIADYSASAFTARCIDLAGHVFYQVTEAL